MTKKLDKIKATKWTLYTSLYHVSRFDIFKKFFECINSNISLTWCTKKGAVYQNVLDSDKRMANLRFWLILSF